MLARMFSVRRLQLALFTLLLVFHSCGPQATESKSLVIPDPKLIEYKTTDGVLAKAVARAQEYLKIKEGGDFISDFYLDSIFVRGDTVELWINHKRHYEVLEYFNKELAKEREAAARGDTLIAINPPPTGNWSGKDRAILYMTKTDSLVDLLVQ